jgi:hypothetical protein
MALRMPISLVRSVTLTSMRFAKSRFSLQARAIWSIA